MWLPPRWTIDIDLRKKNFRYHTIGALQDHGEHIITGVQYGIPSLHCAEAR